MKKPTKDEIKILRVLSQSPQGLTMCVIGNRCGVSGFDPALSWAFPRMDAMEKRGLIEGKDTRGFVYLWYITEMGKKVLDLKDEKPPVTGHKSKTITFTIPDGVRYDGMCPSGCPFAGVNGHEDIVCNIGLDENTVHGGKPGPDCPGPGTYTLRRKKP